MAKTLKEWIAEDVEPYQDKDISWLSQNHFFRDPSRAVMCHPWYFMSPADGIILYSHVVGPDQPLMKIKGMDHTLQSAMRDPDFDETCLVIGIFMTFFDVHVNRVPLSGRLSYHLLDQIDTYNHPMLDVEQSLLEQLRVPEPGPYVHYNERVLNDIRVPDLRMSYYVLQIADYDVNAVTPFNLDQNESVQQGERFSMIRYGSQVDLMIPLHDKYDFEPIYEPGMHVEAGVDALVRIKPKSS